MRYPKDTCVCGRAIGSNNFKRHLRRCSEALKAMAQEGRDVRLLDERSEKERRRRPVTLPED